MFQRVWLGGWASRAKPRCVRWLESAEESTFACVWWYLLLLIISPGSRVQVELAHSIRLNLHASPFCRLIAGFCPKHSLPKQMQRKRASSTTPASGSAAEVTVEHVFFQ